MATGVQSWSKTAATNATADSGVNWAEGMAPSAVNDSSRGEMSSVAKWRDDISGALTTGGTSTAFTLTTNQGSPGSAALMSGAMYCFIPHATSGASPTLAVDGLTARAINQSTGVAVPTGALILGTPYVVTYIHASTEFILQGAVAVATFNDPLQVLSVDAGATVGPILDLYRNSASPAASDFIGSVDFNGKDSGAAKQLYARLIAQITDPTAASEDAIVLLQAVVAGALTTLLQSTTTGISIPGTLALSGALSGVTTLSMSGALSGVTTVGMNGAITGVTAPTVQRLLSGTAQTFTPTAGAVRHRVWQIAGGGGGGGSTANAGAVGVDTSFQVNSTGTAWTCVHGNGGAAGAGAGSTGGAGGTGGTNGSTGTLIDRGDGMAGQGGSNASGNANPGGLGGVSPRGGAGSGSALNTAGGAAKTNSGSGGQGGGMSNSTSGSGGGSGEWVCFWVTGMTTATYTVGGGGNGGAAGTNAGGNGGAGIIIIEEFYS